MDPAIHFAAQCCTESEIRLIFVSFIFFVCVRFARFALCLSPHSPRLAACPSMFSILQHSKKSQNSKIIILHISNRFQNDSEHVGEIFQDEDNMAAILMRRQLENGDLLMVCIAIACLTLLICLRFGGTRDMDRYAINEWFILGMAYFRGAHTRKRNNVKFEWCTVSLCYRIKIKIKRNRSMENHSRATRYNLSDLPIWRYVVRTHLHGMRGRALMPIACTVSKRREEIKKNMLDKYRVVQGRDMACALACTLPLGRCFGVSSLIRGISNQMPIFRQQQNNFTLPRVRVCVCPAHANIVASDRNPNQTAQFNFSVASIQTDYCKSN